MTQEEYTKVREEVIEECLGVMPKEKVIRTIEDFAKMEMSEEKLQDFLNGGFNHALAEWKQAIEKLRE